MHLLHQNLPIYCWGDPCFPAIIETNTGRKRLNILGAYNPEDCSFLHITSEDNCNTERVIEYLELISKRYANILKVHLILVRLLISFKSNFGNLTFKHHIMYFL